MIRTGVVTLSRGARVFKEFDADDSGSISGAELVKVVRTMLPDLKLDTEGWEVLIKRVLEKGDKNHDGSFDFVSAAPFAG